MPAHHAKVEQAAGPTPGEPVEVAPGIRVPGSVLRFSYSTSRGPGGQNVNKRLTRAELRIALDDIPLSERARARLHALEPGRITAEGDLRISADEHRSQRANRRACLDRLRELIVRARAIPKSRRPTRPTRGSVERRLEEKKRRAATKSARRAGGEA